MYLKIIFKLNLDVNEISPAVVGTRMKTTQSGITQIYPNHVVNE